MRTRKRQKKPFNMIGNGLSCASVPEADANNVFVSNISHRTGDGKERNCIGDKVQEDRTCKIGWFGNADGENCGKKEWKLSKQFYWFQKLSQQKRVEFENENWWLQKYDSFNFLLIKILINQQPSIIQHCEKKHEKWRILFPFIVSSPHFHNKGCNFLSSTSLQFLQLSDAFNSILFNRWTARTKLNLSEKSFYLFSGGIFFRFSFFFGKTSSVDLMFVMELMFLFHFWVTIHPLQFHQPVHDCDISINHLRFCSRWWGDEENVALLGNYLYMVYDLS